MDVAGIPVCILPYLFAFTGTETSALSINGGLAFASYLEVS
jgi:hypothetical protein